MVIQNPLSWELLCLGGQPKDNHCDPKKIDFN